MFDILVEFALLLPVIGVLVVMEIVIIPSIIKRRIPYCSKCKIGKFRYKKKDEEKVFVCEKCQTPMKWLEYPEDIFKRRVKYFRFVSALYIPNLLALFLLLLVTTFWPVFLLIGFMCAPIPIGIILDHRSKKEFLKWAEKQGNL